MLAAFALGRLLTSVAVTPGGLGLVEAGSVALLVAMGAEPAQAAAGVLLFTIFTHILEIPFGVLAWLVWLWGRRPSRPRGDVAAESLGGGSIEPPQPPTTGNHRIGDGGAIDRGQHPDVVPDDQSPRSVANTSVKRPPAAAAASRWRYHSWPKTQPNSGGGTRVNTPRVRGPLLALAWLA